MPTTLSLHHRQIQIFRTIMLHGNLSRAAQLSQTSQPTLSRELARLEQVLGYSLFDRVRGRLRPTLRAMALMQEVERSFVGLEQIAARAQELQYLVSGRLRVACVPALAQALLPSALKLFASQAPHTQVSVCPQESPWLEQAMAQQSFDLALSEVQQAPIGVQLKPLFKVNEMVVLPKHHFLSRQSIIEPKDFANQSFVSLAPQDPYRILIDQMFQNHQVERLMNYETDSAAAVCAMVKQGLGLAIVNPLTALELTSPELVMKPLSVDITYQINLLIPDLLTPHPLLNGLVQSLEQASSVLIKKILMFSQDTP